MAATAKSEMEDCNVHPHVVGSAIFELVPAASDLCEAAPGVSRAADKDVAVLSSAFGVPLHLPAVSSLRTRSCTLPLRPPPPANGVAAASAGA